ncbi:hypothetical protein [Streptomyces gilvus]|uniref:hypothetical protein n=1 Tax=Streptomyces gilvus TaxID=2920937 RepID=UPI001F0EC9CC|nr:hypothetical protein [Streptomyces sp. CME 23]MCH5675643.1 hypothetical protein [Streptomyces sp. CME 23]
MPHSKPQDLPKGGGGRWPAAGESFRSVHWGDYEVGYTTVQPLDCTDVYKHLPGGVCPCPHYGYIVEGRLRCVYPGTDTPEEVAETGEVYYFPAGHILVYDEPTTAIEFNPAAALRDLMDSAERVVAASPADYT